MISRIFRAVITIVAIYFLCSLIFLYYPWKEISFDWKATKPPYPSGELKNIFWFVQVSFRFSLLCGLFVYLSALSASINFPCFTYIFPSSARRMQQEKMLLVFYYMSILVFL